MNHYQQIMMPIEAQPMYQPGFQQQRHQLLIQQQVPGQIVIPATYEPVNVTPVNKPQNSEQQQQQHQNTDNNIKQPINSMTASASNRSIKPVTINNSTTTAATSTSTQEAKAVQMDLSLSALKKINETSNKTTASQMQPNPNYPRSYTIFNSNVSNWQPPCKFYLFNQKVILILIL